MPFLVDSLRMELGRHDLTPRLIVHPQLRVRRDVTGAMLEVLGIVDGGRGDGGPRNGVEIAESWTHIEITRLDDDEAARLAADLQRVLGDVRVAVEDYPRMQAKAVLLADELASSDAAQLPDATGNLPDAEVEALLRWLADDHFTFLGYREYDLEDGPDGLCLRAIPGTGLGILRHDKHGSSSFAALPPEVRARARERKRLILTKANSRSTVHRPAYLDYVAVKRMDSTGQVTGEYRFLGLYTHTAYTESITRIPVLRRRLTRVLESAGLAADSHDGKDLAEVLESYPREELFQTTAAELIPIVAGVLRLRERRQTRLFLRKDIYGRYMSCLVYLPRDRYTTKVRLRAQEILRSALDGGQVDYSALIGDSPVARLHIVVRAARGRMLPDVDAAELEGKVAAAARSWDDDFAEETVRAAGRPAVPGAAGHVRGRDTGDLQDRRAGQRRGRRPGGDPAAAGIRRQRGLRAMGVGEFRRRHAGDPREPRARIGRRLPAGLAADHLPVRFPDHADRCAAQAPAHGRGGGRRASVRVQHRRAVLDL